MLTVDVGILTFVVGSLVPLLTGLIVKSRASSKLKSAANLVLSELSGLATYGIAHSGSFQIKALVTAIVTTYLTSGVTYNNLWKPTGVAAKIQGIAPNSGIGHVPSMVDVPGPDTLALPPVVPLDHQFDDADLGKLDDIISEYDRAKDFEAPYVTTLRGNEVYRDPQGYLFVFEQIPTEDL